MANRASDRSNPVLRQHVGGVGAAAGVVEHSSRNGTMQAMQTVQDSAGAATAKVGPSPPCHARDHAAVSRARVASSGGGPTALKDVEYFPREMSLSAYRDWVCKHGWLAKKYEELLRTASFLLPVRTLGGAAMGSN